MTGKTNVTDAIKELREYWRFDRFVASGLAKRAWYLQVVLGILWLIWGDWFSPFARFVIVLFWLVFARLLAEFFIVVFKMADHLREVRKQLSGEKGDFEKL